MAGLIDGRHHLTSAHQKLAYISPYFWPEEIGSAPYCTEFAHYLADQGYAVQVLSTRPFYPKPDAFLAWANGERDFEKIGEIKIWRARFNPSPSAGFKNRLINDLRFASHVARSAFSTRRQKVDQVIVYVPSMIGAFAAWIFARIHQAKLSIIVHDIESGLAQALGLMRDGPAIRLLTGIEKFVLNRADHIVVLTDGMKAELRHIGCRRGITIVPIWGKTIPYRPPSLKAVATIGYSGNFGRKQNLDQLIPILRRLNQVGQRIDIILRGEGSEKAKLKSRIAELNIGGVRFEGLVAEAKLAEALQEIDLHLVPQALGVANYALPSKLISLMSAGRAFIAIAETGSALDVMARESGGGLSFPPQAETEIITAIVSLLETPGRLAEMGRRGRDYVTNHMSRDVVLPALASALGIDEAAVL